MAVALSVLWGACEPPQKQAPFSTRPTPGLPSRVEAGCLEGKRLGRRQPCSATGATLHVPFRSGDVPPEEAISKVARSDCH